MLQVVWEKSACLFIYEAIHTTGLFAPRGLPEWPGASEPQGGGCLARGWRWAGAGGPQAEAPCSQGQHGAHAAAAAH